MQKSGIIPAYINIPGIGWTITGVARWVYIKGELITTGSWMMLPQEPQLSIAGYKCRFSWYEQRVIELIRACVPFFTLAAGVNAIRVGGYPVNVSTQHLLDLLVELQ